MSYAKHETSIKLVEADTETANVVGIENIEAFKEQRVKPKIYGTTLVNLLGKYGNFETDTNADGLADGWTNDAGLTAVANTMDTKYEIFGSECQKITLSADGEGGNYIEATVAAAQALFVAGYIRAGDTATTVKLIVDWRDNTDTQISTDTVGTNATASYVRKSAILTAPANTVKARIYITVAGVSGKLAYFDGIQVHNLTAQGTLDSIRAAKYSETNWSDLTEAQLEAEIPYFDSVMSVNVADGTASELTVRNYGKSIDLQELALQKTITPEVFETLPNSRLRIQCGSAYYNSRLTGRHVSVSLGIRENLIPIKPNTNYIISAEYVLEEGVALTLTLKSTALNHIRPIGSIRESNKSLSFSTDESEVYLDFYCPNNNNSYYVTVGGLVLYEGSAATSYVPPREDSITIPDTVELHGYNGVFNTIDNAGNYTKYWERADKTTDGAGAFTLTGYATGSKVICRNKTNGEVEVLDAAASVTTSWTEEDVEILYQIDTPVSTRLSRTLNLYSGQNNILSPDSKLPIALEFDYTVKGSSETMGFAQNFREVARTEHIEHRPMFLKTSKFYKKAEEYEISMDTVFFDTDLDESQLNGQEFFVEVLKDDETTELETLYSGCYLEAMSDTEDPVRKKGLRLVCQERIL